ncbi:MAG: cation:dicarboxylase symporter family transporter [Prevotella sp.]|nr:cation:dicarboxylase symporter family transporter [Prevotella sp.]
MFHKFFRFISGNLIVAVLLMVVLGIVLGSYMPLWFVRIFITFNGIFTSVLSFIVPVLILALVTSAISETGSGAGKMLVWTVTLAYISTVLAGLFTLGVSDALFPQMVTIHTDAGGGMSGVLPKEAFAPYFTFDFPPMMDTMSALLLSFMLGLAMLKFKLPVLQGAVLELRNVVMMVIEKTIIPLLPIFIFGVFMKMTIAGEMRMVTHVYLKIIAVMVLLLMVVLLLQYLIAGWVSKRNPFMLFHKMFPAFLTALASSSSAATLPVTLRCADKMGARKNVVNFVIPMCANIHLSGACVRTIALVIATMLMFDVSYSGAQMIGFIFIFSVTVLAAPGIPGGVIMAAIGMIEAMLGFHDEMIGIIVTLSIALDSVGTAVNVCGDGALMMIVNRLTTEAKTNNC